MLTESETNPPKKHGLLLRLLDFFVYIVLVVILIQLAIPQIGILRLLAPGGAGMDEGVSNAGPLIAAVEKYKLEQGHYPRNEHVLLYDHYLHVPVPQPADKYSFEYEVFPSKEDPQEYMLSYRIGWSMGAWYCYYSGDDQWLKSYFTCWTSPRPEKKAWE